ncbi:hypothetical protein P43SY_003034 [Pythium insidiosum]|uniref:Uncharacterized protein n=1 Tax=Pythium insidiosum TaxID=114742 RepID=A0AAD5LK48_PYTIN|nr:hypothetical protein P43SY_003034 [Pythium insidiosum]
MNSRRAVHDTVLSDGTFIPAGEFVAVPSYALGRMNHVWGPDARQFRPERWLDEKSPTGLITVSAFKFSAFHAGPRMCLGMNLAMLQIKMLAACVLSKFQLRVDAPDSVTYDVGLTLPIRGALLTRIVEQILKEDWPLLGELWDSCMDQAKLVELGNKPLQKTLARMAAVTSKKELLKLAGELDHLQMSFLVDSGVSPDTEDATKYALNFAYGTFSLPNRSYYLDPEAAADVEATYRQYIASLLELANVKFSGGQQQQGKQSLDTIVSTIMAFEKKLASIYPMDAEIKDPVKINNPMRLSDAISKFPLTVGAFAEGMDVLSRSTLTPESKVNVMNPKYFTSAEKLIVETSLADLKSYFSYIYVHTMVQYLGTPFIQASFQLKKKLVGVQALEPRSETCVKQVMASFPDVVGKHFFLKAFDHETENSAKEMLIAIKKSMGEHIDAAEWLDDATRKAAHEKLSKVVDTIGHSTQKKSYPFFLGRDTYFDNIVKMMSHGTTSSLEKLGKPVNRNDWGSTSAAIANAFYNGQQNKMVFPAGVLQPPFFSKDNHPAQNFGAIGITMGHELTHGFDSKGRKYDGDGNLRNWWTEKTGSEFDERAKCLKEQFSTFPVYGESGNLLGYVNGNLTIGENIADTGGMSLAFRAYQSFKKSGVAFNTRNVTDEEGDQLVFISFAQKWCTKGRDNYFKQALKTNVHSPGEWRSKGPAMNNDAFAQSFRCLQGTKMNPEKKCKLWQM